MKMDIITNQGTQKIDLIGDPVGIKVQKDGKRPVYYSFLAGKITRSRTPTLTKTIKTIHKTNGRKNQ